MKHLFTLCIAVLLSTGNAFSQCSETTTTRVLLLGDSWANFLNLDQTINDALRNAGHSGKKFTTSFTLSENGANTWDFVASGGKQEEIQSMIDANPQIDMIHLSIGGNDLLGNWNVSMTQAETDLLLQEVTDRLMDIIEFLQNTRPGMRVFWAGYTYPNFGEVIDASPFSPHPFFSAWDDMGQPDFATINNLLNVYSDTVLSIAENDPQLDFVPAQAILQHTYGQQQALGIAPGGTYMQFEPVLPYGFPSYPSPIESMRTQFFFTDAFHLSPDAYLDMLNYQTQKFYQKFFMDDMYLLSEGGQKDGSVTSTGIVSQTIKMGEENGDEMAAVLSFPTQNMGDTTLMGGSIFLRRESVSGTDPLAGNRIQIRMISGNLGATANVEADDFSYSVTGMVYGEPCQFGSNNDENWIRLDLTDDMLRGINNGNYTQFILSVPGVVGGTITFSNATDSELAPILNLVYGPNPPPSSVKTITQSNRLSVYPIPTTGSLTIGIENGSIVLVEVFNILGSVVLNPSVTDNRIDISELTNGTYILKVTTQEGVGTKRIIKR